jgi:23S rRNA pseudouridine1911/1915/1917 synthase
MSLPSSTIGSGPPLEILLDDAPVLAVNKPAGLLTQGVPQGIPSLEAQVKSHLKERFNKRGNVYLGIPHRLDRPVSGVIVFARNSKSARRLAEQFQQRQVRKLYWTVTENAPKPPDGTLHDWLRKLPAEARTEVVAENTPSARECLLNYHTIARTGDRALIEVELITGRMHQIRIQFASRGWHLIGDLLYGAQTRLAEDRSENPRDRPIALHARSLTFLHPVRYQPITVIAPVPAAWSALGPFPAR